MIRRPLTEITLKIEDLQKYEALRGDQKNSSSIAELHDGTPKPLAPGQKTIDEIHNRIGFAPKKKSSGPSTV